MGRRAARGSVAATLAWLGVAPHRAAAGAGEEGALPPCDPADAPCVDRFPPALADIYTDCAGLVAELTCDGSLHAGQYSPVWRLCRATCHSCCEDRFASSHGATESSCAVVLRSKLGMSCEKDFCRGCEGKNAGLCDASCHFCPPPSQPPPPCDDSAVADEMAAWELAAETQPAPAKLAPELTFQRETGEMEKDAWHKVNAREASQPRFTTRKKGQAGEMAREAARALRAVQNEQSRSRRQSYLEARARETLLDVWLLPVVTSLSTFAVLEWLRRRYGPALRQRCSACCGGRRKKRR